METKSLFSLIFVFQVIINGVNIHAIPPNQQGSICGKNGNFNSDNLTKARDDAFNALIKGFGLPEPYDGNQIGNGIGVWARAICPPNIKKEDCRECVKETIPVVKKNCPKQKEGAAWSILPKLYCMVRYADQQQQTTLAEWADFFPTPTQPLAPASAGELEKGLNNLANKLKDMTNGVNNVKSYGSGSITYGSGSHTLYGSMQCSVIISEENCRKCLTDATNRLHNCCSKTRKQSGRAFSVHCVFWYSHINFLP